MLLVCEGRLCGDVRAPPRCGPPHLSGSLRAAALSAVALAATATPPCSTALCRRVPSALRVRFKRTHPPHAPTTRTTRKLARTLMRAYTHVACRSTTYASSGIPSTRRTKHWTSTARRTYLAARAVRGGARVAQGGGWQEVVPEGDRSVRGGTGHAPGDMRRAGGGVRLLSPVRPALCPHIRIRFEVAAYRAGAPVVLRRPR